MVSVVCVNLEVQTQHLQHSHRYRSDGQTFFKRASWLVGLICALLSSRCRGPDATASNCQIIIQVIESDSKFPILETPISHRTD